MARRMDGATRITKTSGPDPDSVIIPTRFEKVVAIDKHSYSVAWAGHGPFLTIKVYDSEFADLPKVGLEFTRSQAIALRDSIDLLLPELIDA